MSFLQNPRKRTVTLMLGISLLCWLLILAAPGSMMAIGHCPMTGPGMSQASLEMLLAMNPIGPMLTGWLLMVLAMMLPKVIVPVLYICDRSFKRRRLRAALLFLGAYTGVWLAVSLLLIATFLGMNLLVQSPYFIPLIVGIAALIWQCSPIKQRCLNGGHDHPALAAFGWKADRDALRFGIVHGFWCVGSGWALMLFPMLLPAGHNPAMLAVTVLMISEHLEHPQVPRWRLNLSGKLLRGLYAQTEIRWQQVWSLHWQKS